jgi:dethiobiotin synthetase
MNFERPHLSAIIADQAFSSTPAFLITGSDTDVGKTWLACQLIRRLKQHFSRVGAYKPVASGCDTLAESDGYLLWQAIGRGSLDEVCPVRLKAPLAPMYAAETEGIVLEAESWKAGFRVWQQDSDLVIVEGAGGLLSPLIEGYTNADLASELKLPVLIVVRNQLGAINQGLMAIECAWRRQLSVAALVLNQTKPEPSHASLSRHAVSIQNVLVKQGIPAPPIIEMDFQQNNVDELVDALLSELRAR